VAPSPERQREIADFFAAHERDVRQSVAYRVRHLPAAAIEDACQTAWEKLSRRPDVDLTATGELREPAGDDPDLADRVADKLLHARQLGDLRTIKAEDRQALYLKALGFRDHEIAALLSITYTAVNRRITEGRRRLRELEAAHDDVSGHSRTCRALKQPPDGRIPTDGAVADCALQPSSKRRTRPCSASHVQ
jgi:DNA-directed RNA polymerase specialized sigma24 family protein